MNNPKRKPTASKTPRKILALIAVICVALLASGVVVAQRRADKQDVTPVQDTTNYSPPTEQEKSDGDEKKKEIIENSKKDKEQGEPDQAAKHVTPLITSWETSGSNIVFRGYVPDALEATGSCTVRLTRSGTEVTGTSQATPDSQHMNCKVSVPATSISGSGWTAALTYTSAKYQGASAGEAYPE